MVSAAPGRPDGDRSSRALITERSRMQSRDSPSILRAMVLLPVLLALSFLGPVPRAAAGDAAPGPEESRPARPRVGIERINADLAVLRIAGVSTTVLLGPDGVLVVDPGYEQAAPLIEEEIRKLGGGEIKTIIDTHWHFDHAGGNKSLGRGADVTASEETRKWLSADQRLLGMDQPAYPDFARPRAITLPSETIRDYRDDVVVSSLPGGHTGGDILVHFEKSRVLAIGDIVFAGQFPFIDIDHGGSVLDLADVLRQIIEGFPEDTKIVPGHGHLLSIQDLSTYRQMVVQTTDVVRQEMDRDRSLEEIREKDVLKDWEGWDGSFKRSDWIEFIYRSLKD